MFVSLTIVRYPKKFIFFALLAMAVHRLPGWLNKGISFFKLMGSGRNGTFDIQPDWQQWAIFAVHKNEYDIAGVNPISITRELYGPFISKWYKLFGCETYTILLEPLEGHGRWDGREPFGPLPRNTPYDGPLAVLTRATIRLSRLKAFWANVDKVAVQMTGAQGFEGSFGIGEIPFIKQATFSLWQNKQHMIQFAYKMREHNEVIKKTRQDNWYSEELFVRFKPIKAIGSIQGKNPLAGML